MRHITPTEDVFNKMISIATIIWMQYDDQFGYVTDKLAIIKNINNTNQSTNAILRIAFCFILRIYLLL